MSDTNDMLQRYYAAVHAMQSGVAYEMNSDPRATEPKHLRVGVNTALRNQASLTELLISKGIITEDELMKALALGMEKEQALFENRHGCTFA